MFFKIQVVILKKKCGNFIEQIKKYRSFEICIPVDLKIIASRVKPPEIVLSPETHKSNPHFHTQTQKNSRLLKAI